MVAYSTTFKCFQCASKMCLKICLWTLHFPDRRSVGQAGETQRTVTRE